MRKILWVFLILALAAPALAEDVAVVIKGVDRGKEYRLSIGADGSVSVVPLLTVTVGGGPTNPPPTNPPPTQPPTAFESEIEKLTKAALDSGGSKTTGAAISAVYSLVADEIEAGRLPLASVRTLLSAATNRVMADPGVTDDAKWTDWRTKVGDALVQLEMQEKLGTPKLYAGVLREISRGMDRATGNELSPKQLMRMDAATLAAFDASDGKADGILDGINLQKLMELIRFVMDLIKLFTGGM